MVCLLSEKRSVRSLLCLVDKLLACIFKTALFYKLLKLTVKIQHNAVQMTSLFCIKFVEVCSCVFSVYTVSWYHIHVFRQHRNPS
jgi:hypothetical protein